jgi:hypothetical protein
MELTSLDVAGGKSSAPSAPTGALASIDDDDAEDTTETPLAVADEDTEEGSSPSREENSTTGSGEWEDVEEQRA